MLSSHTTAPGAIFKLRKYIRKDIIQFLMKKNFLIYYVHV